MSKKLVEDNEANFYFIYLPSYSSLTEENLNKNRHKRKEVLSIGKTQPMELTRANSLTRGLGTTRRVGKTAMVIRRCVRLPSSGLSDVTLIPSSTCSNAKQIR